jgi:hypothetical protein
MSDLSPEPLSTSGRRALAATMLGTATRLPALSCTLLIDVKGATGGLRR